MTSPSHGRCAGKVAVVQPPLAVHGDFVDYPYHCDLGVVQAAATLRQANIAVAAVDAFAMASSDALTGSDGRLLLGAPVPDVATRVADAGLCIVHYTPFHRPPQRDALLATLLGALRAGDEARPIILADLYVGGMHYVHSADAAVLAAYPEVDAFVRFEAEAALPRLCADLLSNGRPAQRLAIAGMSSPMEQSPPAAWDMIDLAARDRFMAKVAARVGRRSRSFPIDGRTLPAVTSRGCPFRCIHCTSNPEWAPPGPKTQRRLGPKATAELVDALVQMHGATRVAFLDEMANVDGEHFDNLLATANAAGVAFDFPNGLRADRLEPRQLAAMAGSISTLSVSAESGVQRVVDDVVGKNLDLAVLEKTVSDAAELEIATIVHFMIGLPGESAEEINQTATFALRLWDAYGAYPAIQFAVPLPATGLAKLAERVLGTGQPLPADYGPLFQHEPRPCGDQVPSEQLRRFKWTFDRRLEASKQPAKVIINTTYRCNNHCQFCAVGNRSPVDGDPSAQRAALRQHRDLGVEAVDFDGGEPTLNSELLPLIRYARRVGYRRINVTTNGRRCAYPAFARQLTRSGATSLLFSLHGPDAATHGGLVGVAEAFEQTVTGIRNCVSEAPATLRIGLNVTLARSNIDGLPELGRLAWELGLRWMNIQFLTPFGRATVEQTPPMEQATAAVAQVIDRFEPQGMDIQVINLPFCFLPGYERHLAGDLLKLRRTMVFVGDEQVNLQAYLAEQREYDAECAPCPYRVFCAGKYIMRDEPEPPWLSPTCPSA